MIRCGLEVMSSMLMLKSVLSISSNITSLRVLYRFGRIIVPEVFLVYRVLKVWLRVAILLGLILDLRVLLFLRMVILG